MKQRSNLDDRCADNSPAFLARQSRRSAALCKLTETLCALQTCSRIAVRTSGSAQVLTGWRSSVLSDTLGLFDAICGNEPHITPSELPEELQHRRVCSSRDLRYRLGIPRKG
jgi:hypothetical protein